MVSLRLYVHRQLWRKGQDFILFLFLQIISYDNGVLSGRGRAASEAKKRICQKGGRATDGAAGLTTEAEGTMRKENP